MFSTPRHGRVREGPHPWEGTFFDFFSGSVRAPNRFPGWPPGGWFRTLRGGSWEGSGRGLGGGPGTEIFDLGSTSIRVENLVPGRGYREGFPGSY
jgi:hypothetical protein